MTVFVDDMEAQFGRMIMCHMIADTDDELHMMADRIGVARKWFQGDHYDIAKSKRSRALDLGATAITWRQCGMMAGIRRRGVLGPLVRPEEVEARWDALIRLRRIMRGDT